MGNKVKFGLKNAHYAKITENAGVRSFGTPVPLPGAVNLTADPKGEKTEFYADDIAYFTADSNQGYEGNLEIALVPDSFRKDILNYKEDANGALFEDAEALPNNFALLFEFNGDAKKTRHVFYDVNPSRPNISGVTKGATIAPQTETFDFVAGPDPDTGYPKASIKQGQSGYDTFFDAVYTYQDVTNSLTPTTDTFSKAAPADVTLTVTSSAIDNTIHQVQKDGVILVSPTNYTVADLVVTIPQAYLATLDNGDHVFTVIPTKGLSVTCTVTVED